jgi:hypothetical protein
MNEEQYHVNEYNDNIPDNGAEGFPEENSGAPAESVDWKTEAIRAQAKLEMLQQAPMTQQAAAPAQISEAQRLEAQVEELRSSMPQLDSKNPDSFWDREKHKERLDEVRHQLAEARERERRQALMNVEYQTRSQVTVNDVKRKFSQRPAFSKIERQFDNMVNQLAPHVRADPNALTVMMKTLLFDAGDTGGAKAPPSAPSGAYSPSRGGPRKSGKVEFKSEQEAQIAAYYGMTAEEYYDPKYNEAGPNTEGNGVSIYPYPIGGRR